MNRVRERLRELLFTMVLDWGEIFLLARVQWRPIQWNIKRKVSTLFSSRQTFGLFRHPNRNWFETSFSEEMTTRESRRGARLSEIFLNEGNRYWETNGDSRCRKTGDWWEKEVETLTPENIEKLAQRNMKTKTCIHVFMYTAMVIIWLLRW